MIDIKKSPEKLLDALLKYLDNDEEFQETHQKIMERGRLGISMKDLHLMIDKLCRDGYVSFSHVTIKGIPTKERTFYISYNGRLFINRGGYQHEINLLKRNQLWTVTKIIAAAFNAVAIILVGVWGVSASVDAKSKDEQITNLTLKVDSLSKRIDSQKVNPATDSLQHKE